VKSVTRDGTAGTVVREVLEKPLEAKVVGVVGVGHTRACLLGGGGTYISFRGAEAQKLGAMEEFDDSILKTK